MRFLLMCRSVDGGSMGHYVYKYVLNDEVIYIGKTDQKIQKRLYQHGRKGDNIPQCAWNDINNAEIFYIELANSTMSDVVESELIRRYKPKYNKAKTSDWTGLQFEEPEWKKYNLTYSKSIKEQIKKECNPLIDDFKTNEPLERLLQYVIDSILNNQYVLTNITQIFSPSGNDKKVNIQVKAPKNVKYKDFPFVCTNSNTYKRLKKDHEEWVFPASWSKGNDGIKIDISIENGLEHIKGCWKIIREIADAYFLILETEQYDKQKNILDEYDQKVTQLEKKWQFITVEAFKERRIKLIQDGFGGIIA